MKGTIPRGQKRHLIALQNPTGAFVPDGDGGFTETLADLDPPSLYAAITPATARDLERIAAGTVISTATHVIRADYHPQVTTKTKVTFHGRTFSIVGVQNLEERNVEMELVAVEVVA